MIFVKQNKTSLILRISLKTVDVQYTLYCTVLYCTVLYCTVLYRYILDCTVDADMASKAIKRAPVAYKILYSRVLKYFYRSRLLLQRCMSTDVQRLVATSINTMSTGMQAHRVIANELRLHGRAQSYNYYGGGRCLSALLVHVDHCAVDRRRDGQVALASHA